MFRYCHLLEELKDKYLMIACSLSELLPRWINPKSIEAPGFSYLSGKIVEWYTILQFVIEFHVMMVPTVQVRYHLLKDRTRKLLKQGILRKQKSAATR